MALIFVCAKGPALAANIDDSFDDLPSPESLLSPVGSLPPPDSFDLPKTPGHDSQGEVLDGDYIPEAPGHALTGSDPGSALGEPAEAGLGDEFPFDEPLPDSLSERETDSALPLPPMPEEPGMQRRLIVSDGEGGVGEATAEEVFDLRMRTISEQVSELKEQVSRTKARLQLLADAVLGGSGVTSGAKLILEHHNQLGGAFRLVGVQYSLNGAPAFLHFDESGDFDKLDQVHVYDQRVVPGEHQLVVRYTIRGRGHGIFAYLENYTLELTATHDFTVEPGMVTSVRALLREKADLTLPFEERPDVAFETHVETDFRSEGRLPQASAGGAGP